MNRRVSLEALLSLLREGRAEEICAAALVLGRLDPGGARVTRALGEALERAPTPTRPYVLDALGRLRDPGALRLVAPLLLATGALREQASRILERHDGRVLEELERLVRTGAPPGHPALTWVALTRGTPEALRFLAAMLQASDFEGARTIHLAVRARSPEMNAGTRRVLAAEIRRVLRSCPATTEGETVAIACLKILGTLGRKESLPAILGHLKPQRPAALRRTALDVLLEMEVPSNLHPRVARLVRGSMNPEDPPRLTLSALRLLRRVDPQGVSMDELLRLAGGRNAPLAREALLQLGRFHAPGIERFLLAALLERERPVAEAAASALEDHPGVLPALLLAHGDPRRKERRELIARTLAGIGRSLTARRFSAAVRKALADLEEPREMERRLIALAVVDRERLCRHLERQAREALRKSLAEDVLRFLEPLVRRRLASPRGRHLLALAHLMLATARPDDPHMERALTLIGPLTRIAGWNCRSAFSRERLLSPTQRKLLVARLAQRSRQERDLAAHLRRIWGPDA